MVDIIPALLVCSVRDLEEGLEKLKGVSDWVQVDLVGANYLHGGESFPLWEDFNFEADLMLGGQAAEAEELIRLGAARVVVHAAGEEAREALAVLQQYRTGDFAVGVGIALRAHDTPDALRPFDGLFDYVQVMGIDHEGKQGEPPDPHHKDIELVRAVRKAFPELVIQVDGAVAPRVKELVRAGATRLVVGSAIVKADDPKGAYKSLYNEANGSQ